MLIAALIMLASCNMDEGNTDAEGYALPRGCTAVYVPTLPVYRVPRLGISWNGSRTNARVSPDATGRPAAILIADDLTGWRYQDTLKHERWHEFCEATRDTCCRDHFKPVGVQ